MPKILQINATANWGSTGRIAEHINNMAQERGWDCYIAYGRYMNKSQSKLIKVGSKLATIAHYIENLILDNEGLASRRSTKRLIQRIKEIKPDIIHLHNIHDHWLNYRILFEYLNTTNISLVWTQHDCWSFTGGCTHYHANECYKWQKGCSRCAFRKTCIDQSSKQYKLRKQLFSNNLNLTIVPVSEWLRGEVEKSFMKNLKIKTIYNGVDLNVFRERKDENIINKYSLKDKYVLLCLATKWTEKKGLYDYIKLAEMLPSDCVIVMVGVTSKIKKILPENIVALERTNDLTELVELYSISDIVLNLSYEETFGMTTIEGMACGTPAIVYNATASPELVDDETGIVVPAGDIRGVISAISYIRKSDSKDYSIRCRKRVEKLFDMSKCYNQYIELYESILMTK